MTLLKYSQEENTMSFISLYFALYIYTHMKSYLEDEIYFQAIDL